MGCSRVSVAMHSRWDGLALCSGNLIGGPVWRKGWGVLPIPQPHPHSDPVQRRESPHGNGTPQKMLTITDSGDTNHSLIKPNVNFLTPGLQPSNSLAVPRVESHEQTRALATAGAVEWGAGGTWRPVWRHGRVLWDGHWAESRKSNLTNTYSVPGSDGEVMEQRGWVPSNC